MNKTKIDWCDYTWNPVTGCLHDCPYCYARNYAEIRFGGASETHRNETVGTECQWFTKGTGELHVLTEPLFDPDSCRDAPYPFEFDPTFHLYRLGEPMRVRKPQSIFVGSMADMFGEWVPEKWIKSVFKACNVAPWHRYLFLTKNPHAYYDYDVPNADNYWYGQSDDGYQMLTDYREFGINTFLSIEPLLRDMSHKMPFDWFKWVIVGAESGNREGKIVPKREWVAGIVRSCKETGTPLFMKSSLKKIWGEPLIQEFPWGG